MENTLREISPVSMPRAFPNAFVLLECFALNVVNAWKLFNKGWCTGVSPLYRAGCPGYAGELNLTLLASHKTAGTLGTIVLSLPTSLTTSQNFRWQSTNK